MSEKLTPKDYLMQIRKLRVLIDQREKELDRLREQTFSSASGIDYSRIPVKGARRVGASFEQAANKALDLTGEVAGLIDEYNDLRHKIIGEIQSLDRPEYMQVLYKRYVEEKHWEEISVEMGYSCDHIKKIIGVLGELFKPIADLLGDVIFSELGRLFDAIGMIFDVLSGLIDFVVGAFTGDWEGAWQGIKNAASAVWEWLKSSFSSVGDIFGGVWQALKNGASAAWKGIQSVFSSVASFFERIFKNAWERVKSVFSTGGKIFSGIKDGIVSAFKSIVNKIISGINTVVAVPFNGINAALKKIKGISIFGLKPFSWLGTIGVPKIPMLAQGGYVKANTPQLAMIGDNRRYGEIVAPEDKMLEMILTALKMFSQQNPPPKPHDNEESQLIELVVNLGDETLMRKIIKLLREEQRRGNYEFSI